MVYVYALLDLLELFVLTEHVIPKIPPIVVEMDSVNITTQLMHTLANVPLNTLAETIAKSINYPYLVLIPIPTEMPYSLVILSVSASSILLIADAVNAVPILLILLTMTAIAN
jgi:hypothetical protein